MFDFEKLEMEYKTDSERYAILKHYVLNKEDSEYPDYELVNELETEQEELRFE